MSDAAGEDGLMLIPAHDEPATSGRHIPLLLKGRMNAAALLARRGLSGLAGGPMGGSSRKGMDGGISAGSLPDLVSILGPAITAVAGVAVGWLQGRAGRKVRLKMGDTEAEARTVEELKELLGFAREISSKPPKNEG